MCLGRDKSELKWLWSSDPVWESTTKTLVAEGMASLSSSNVTDTVVWLSLDLETSPKNLVEARVILFGRIGRTNFSPCWTLIGLEDSSRMCLGFLFCVVDDRSHFRLVSCLSGISKESGMISVYLTVHLGRYSSVSVIESLVIGFLKRLACSNNSRMANEVGFFVISPSLSFHWRTLEGTKCWQKFEGRNQAEMNTTPDYRIQRNECYYHEKGFHQALGIEDEE